MQTVLNLLEAEPIRLFLSFAVILFLVLNLAGILTFAERKVAAYIQLRYGPNRVGPRGLVQPAAAVVTLFTKKNVMHQRADTRSFSGAAAGRRRKAVRQRERHAPGGWPLDLSRGPDSHVLAGCGRLARGAFRAEVR